MKNFKDYLNENIMTVKDSDGDVWYVKKIDDTHVKISSSKDKFDSTTAYHIAQLKNRPYYKEIESWLNEEGKD
jgi:hypothetical protein